MNLNDIMQLVLQCALSFVPLGYYARNYLRRIRGTTILLFARPRYVKSAGILKRAKTRQGNPKK